MPALMSLHLESKGTYLHAVITGTFDLDEAKQLTAQVFEATSERQIFKVLIDVLPLQGTLSTIERYDYAVYVTSLYKSHLSRRLTPPDLIYLGSYPIIDPDRFGETVAFNRGVRVKVTTSVEEAMDWLGLR